MGIASILLFVFAVLFMGIGLITAWLPVIGFLFAFGSPALALLGVILGGAAMSKAKRMGLESGSGLVGVILNTLVIIPSLLVAFTCGVCNACVSSAVLDPTNAGRWDVVVKPGPFQIPPKKPAKPSDEPEDELDEPDDPHQPPPLFPPPPLDPGPSKKP
jgi:hypothetical protein